MQQSTKVKMFRITYNKAKPSLIKSQKAVHLPIHRPVLDQYNSITLDKTSKYQRIKHKSTSAHYPEKREEELAAENHPNNKMWENTVDSYIKSKRKIQQKKGDLDVSFHFHHLDKTNQHRYFKLITEQAIPLSSVKLRDYFQDKPTRPEDPPEDPIESEERQLLVKSTPEANFLGSSQGAAPQEKVIHHFIQTYFKNKYKQEQRQRSNLISNSFALPRNNTH